MSRLFRRGRLPLVLQRNLFFRKIFLWRKIYFSKTRSHHFGQFAEDVTLNRFFPKDYKGTFVDVGCFHPVKYNNTWMFYRRGWRGLNIDIDAIKIEAFDMRRPGDTNIALAVSDRKGVVRCRSRGFYSLMTTLSDEFSEGLDGYVDETVASDTLTNILSASSLAGKRIDLLSIDVEGHENQVLSGLDFETYRPRVIAMESHSRSLSELNEEPSYQKLIREGYDVSGWCGLTVLFVHRGWLTSLASS